MENNTEEDFFNLTMYCKLLKMQVCWLFSQQVM